MQYDTKDGLAGSSVYDMCQDKDGFMWFGTENGLTRFDGTNFKNYTVKDGLPDNEIIKLFCDSKGRVWIGSFNKDICFYFNGHIYNKQNCKWLNKIELKGAALAICEDEKGVIMISDIANLVQVEDSGHIENLNAKPFLKKYKGQKIYCTPNYFDGGFFVSIHDTTFILKNDHLELLFLPGDLSEYNVLLKTFRDGTRKNLRAPNARISQTYIRNVSNYVSTVNGAWSIDTTKFILQTHFLPGKKVSHTLNDSEGNIWFSTFGEGVFKLASLEMKNVLFPISTGITDYEVFSLEKYNGRLLCGLGFSKICFIEENKVDTVLDYAKLTYLSNNNMTRNKLHTCKLLTNGEVILGFDAFLLKLSNNNSTIKSLIAIKSIDQIDDQLIMVGAYNYAYRMRIKDLQIVDTLYTGRCTKVVYSNGRYYIGTLNGLFEIEKNKTKTYLGDLNSILSRRISDMKVAGNGTIWVATNDAGLVAYKDGKVITTITEKNGLSSNICKSLFLADDFLYAGTNKGINKIDLKNKTHSILKYTMSDGLPSDVINALYVMDSTVYVASPKGLTYFKETAIPSDTFCKLKLLNIRVSGNEYNLSASSNLSYKNNNIAFEYIAFSYRSGGDITYTYKLTGLDTAWRTTAETNLVYQTLPAGNYKLELYAINKFGTKSNAFTLPFTISQPFWKTWWYYLAIITIFFSIVIAIFRQRNKAVQERLLEKSNNQKQFAILEQQALQAQMNPHFIFNCLNSIQQYILINDKHKANLYLTGFSSLIRGTLNFSAKKTIKVREEVDFLGKYLDMEKMRFGDSFRYVISGTGSMEIDYLDLPALLLQPYVENALRHGIRYKQLGQGIVQISFSLVGEFLVCCIKDNGIGRAKAAEYKTLQHIEYQSKGMSLTASRIDLLNKINDGHISVQINDLTNISGEAEGTEVIIKIPV